MRFPKNLFRPASDAPGAPPRDAPIDPASHAPGDRAGDAPRGAAGEPAAAGHRPPRAQGHVSRKSGATGAGNLAGDLGRSRQPEGAGDDDLDDLEPPYAGLHSRPDTAGALDPGDPGAEVDPEPEVEALLASHLADPPDPPGQPLDVQRGRAVYRGDMIELVYSRSRSSRPSQSEWADMSDRDLLLTLRDGSERALDELIGRKTKPLLQLVSRILGDLEEARDVVQVTFFKVWENRRKFDERWSPNTWIYRIASNLAIDHLRSRRSRERIQEPVRQHLRQVADGRAHRDLSRLQQGEVATIFRELSASLSEKQRMVFLLREVEGLSSPEVAAILGCRESTVRNHLFNARKYLRTELLRRYPEYAGAMAGAGAGDQPLPGLSAREDRP